MKNLNELCEGILDVDADIEINGFQQYLFQYINPGESGWDFVKLNWDDPKRYDVVQAIINQLKTYPTIPSAEAKKRIKAGDINIVGLHSQDGVYSDISDIYLFNHDGITWTNRSAAASKHIHLITVLNNDEKWKSDIYSTTSRCNTISRDIDKFYDCSI